MTVAVYISVYAGLIVFLAGAILRVVRYAKTPVHLRWELYPVPHEDPKLARHGGSSFEVSDSSRRPAHFSLRGELRAMVPEIAYLKALREFNRPLWYASFLFHFGLYLTVATGVLLMLRAMLPASAEQAIGFLHGAYTGTGYAAAGMTIVGACALLWRRATDSELKNYTSPADLFNLAFFIIVYATVAAGCLVSGGASPLLCARGLLTFDTSVRMGPVLGFGMILAACLVSYIPFTHMAHFIAKYFTYHLVRWDDRPNVRGGRIETQVAGFLAQAPTWSAAHIGADGKKTWADLATSNPVAEAQK